MTIHDLIQGIEVVEAKGDLGVPVSGLDYDSRRIRPGQAFFAIPGLKTDGALFSKSALEHGALVIVGESASDREPWVRVAHARRALAQASANFYRHPSKDLSLIGITGTNGKTTTAFIVHSILEAGGKTTGLVGTIEYRLGSKRTPAPHTTPESLELQALLAEWRRMGATHAVMEVSSHALALDRVWGDTFRVAVFTNLTRDHLDFHGDMDRYLAAKKLLFTGQGVPPPECAVLNADDPRSAELAKCGNKRVLWYGLNAADVAPNGEKAIRTPLGEIPNRSKLLGRTNLYNTLAAVGAAVALDVPAQAIEDGIQLLECVPGRFEKVDAGQPFLVIVDYAHTDDALKNVLATARELNPRRIITVFGCGGDRDRTKRPLMGRAVGEASDLAMVTSDNPRSEDPAAIIEEALQGLRPTGLPFHVEVDRAAAIELAIGEAAAGDLVLIAGKGHETYQVIGKEMRRFDDREAAREALGRRGF